MSLFEYISGCILSADREPSSISLADAIPLHTPVAVLFNEVTRDKDIDILTDRPVLITLLDSARQAPASAWVGNANPDFIMWLERIEAALHVWEEDEDARGNSFLHDALGSWPAKEREAALSTLTAFGSQTQAARIFSALIQGLFIARFQKMATDPSATAEEPILAMHLTKLAKIVQQKLTVRKSPRKASSPAKK